MGFILGHFITSSSGQPDGHQCDKIERIFAYWVIVHFGSYNNRSSTKF
jgi:hypothetical protein